MFLWSCLASHDGMGLHIGLVSTIRSNRRPRFTGQICKYKPEEPTKKLKKLCTSFWESAYFGTVYTTLQDEGRREPFKFRRFFFSCGICRVDPKIREYYTLSLQKVVHYLFLFILCKIKIKK